MNCVGLFFLVSTLDTSDSGYLPSLSRNQNGDKTLAPLPTPGRFVDWPGAATVDRGARSATGLLEPTTLRLREVMRANGGVLIGPTNTWLLADLAASGVVRWRQIWVKFPFWVFFGFLLLCFLWF